MSFVFLCRHTDAPEWLNLHCGVPQGSLLQGVHLLQGTDAFPGPDWNVSWELSTFYSILKQIDGLVLNSLQPGDAIWRLGSRSTLAQAMAWCLKVPSHYVIQCWSISQVSWHSSECNFTSNAQDICTLYEFKNDWFNFTNIFPRGQKVKRYNPSISFMKTFCMTHKCPLFCKDDIFCMTTLIGFPRISLQILLGDCWM